METLREKRKHQQTRREFLGKTALAAAGLPLASAINPLQGLSPLDYPAPGSEDSPWKIHLFSKHLQFLDYEAMAKACLESGLDGVDLSVRPRGHVVPENVERDLPQAAAAIRNAGLDFSMMTTAITDVNDPATERILKTASSLGVKYYRMGYYRYVKEVGPVKSMEIFKYKMAKLAELNEKYNIHGAYQNHAGGNFGAPVWDLWQTLRDLDPRWIGCQYDIRHAVVEGAQSWPLGIELLKDHIRCMVIKDFHWNLEEGRWGIKNVPIGEGMVDFKAYFRLIRQYAISGPISLHIEYPIYPDENMSVVEKQRAAIKTIQRDVKALKGLLPV